MRHRLLSLGLMVVLTTTASAQDVLTSPRRDPRIESIVAEISSERIEAAVRNLVSFGTRHTMSDQDDPAKGIGAARRWIETQFSQIREDSGGRLVVELDEFEQPEGGRITKPTKIVNLVATLPGKNKDRVLVVSGHYDSIPRPMADTKIDAPGANDDASGTAAVIEMARVMAKHEFDATIVFLAVAGEEQGLLGSTHWAELSAKAGRKIEAMLTNDIVGNTDGGNGIKDNNRVRLFSEGVPTNETEAEARLRKSVGGENDGASRQLARMIKAVGERYVPGFGVTLVFRRDRFGRGGDHIPFNERGIPAVRFTEPNEDFSRQHEKVETRDGKAYGDVPDRVDYPYVAQVARVNAATLATMALAPAPPENVRFAASRQGYDTPITWKPNTEDDVVGYRVLWRETFEPFWTHSLEVTDAKATITRVSKDDCFFAVQSIDRDGNASVPVFVRPASGR